MNPFKEIEDKWQKFWEEKNIFRAEPEKNKKKIYCLEMFPYPSGSGLHVGHLKNYLPTDAFCRFKSMQGFTVLHPMGWDAFGQPAENEAIKRGRNPREMVPEYVAGYKRTLIKAGCSYDWTREINSSLPDYYRWTQWFFLLLYKKGLAYRTTAPINWCPSCKTGLANEEVKEGRCWRCDTLVEKKPMPQWFFKITAYADRLLADLDHLDWTEGMKDMQRDWIGRSEGAEVIFKVAGTGEEIGVFTTRPDTLFGATFLVLAPENPLVPRITIAERRIEVETYIKKAQSESEMDRLKVDRIKTGIHTGAYAVNPANGQEIPIWIADYVLLGYGTGAIMSVPGHDVRDFEFAKKYSLPVIQVVSKDGTNYELRGAETEEGIAVNSGQWNGMRTADFKKAITRWLEEKSLGRYAVNYRLRDWLISRQRYWGAPIPIIHCRTCGEVPVPEDRLPVLLPRVDNYQPSGTGESPLANIPEFVNTPCPKCSGPARRETDTMGGYACSSWYFFRFADPNNPMAFASREALDYWLPVDVYTGGIEHARSHLLYSRFWTKVLYDEGFVGFQEPFLTLHNQGSLLAYTPGRRPRSSDESSGEEKDENVLDWIVLKPEELDGFPEEQIVWRWARMSKSKGNVVTPDEIIQMYGTDSLRVYEMFVAPYEDNVHWTEEGIQGSFRFVSRVWRWLHAALPFFQSDWKAEIPAQMEPEERQIRRRLHQTVRKVESDIEHFQFNTAIAAIMEFVNEIYKYVPMEREIFPEKLNRMIVSEILEILVLIIAPFAPHLSEEVWHKLGNETTVYKAPWPTYSPEAAAEDKINIMIQINGKIRDKLMVTGSESEDDIHQKAFAREKVKQYTSGKRVVKTIYIKDRMLSIVVK